MSSSRTLWFQRILQALLALIFVAVGAANLSGQTAADFARLGYPTYLCTILGTAYLLGVVCLYQPFIAFLRDWAWAGFAISLVGAATSHILGDDPVSAAAPALVLLGLLGAAYALHLKLRPR